MTIDNIMLWCSMFYLCTKGIDLFDEYKLEPFIRPYFIGAMLALFIIKFA